MAKQKSTLQRIDELIDVFGKELNDEEFLEALEQMIDRAQSALDARKEELGEE